MKRKRLFKLAAMAVAIVLAAVVSQSFASSSEAPRTDKYRTFVKTSCRCQKSNCKCSGYRGYKHGNGTYEGACSNTDGYGHTCGHGPEKHGLKRW